MDRRIFIPLAVAAIATLSESRSNAGDRELTVGQQLVVAAYELDVDGVQKLLAGGVNPDSRMGRHEEHQFEDKWTLGYPLASSKWTPLLAVAQSSKAPQPEKPAENTTEGLDAARRKLQAIDPKLIRERDERRTRIAKLLIASKANLDLDDGHGTTALHAAIDSRFDSLSLLLIEVGAQVNTKQRVYIDGPDGLTPLHDAADRPAIVEALLKHGANVNAVDSEDDTPLHRAVLHHNPRSVELLLAAGADPSAKDSEGRTPAYWCRTVLGPKAPEEAVKRQISAMLKRAQAK